MLADVATEFPAGLTGIQTKNYDGKITARSSCAWRWATAYSSVKLLQLVRDKEHAGDCL
jgi:hypothetical protein